MGSLGDGSDPKVFVDDGFVRENDSNINMLEDTHSEHEVE